MPLVELHVPADHPAFAGHFPGQPLLPGVSLLAEVLEAVCADAPARAWVGPQPRLGAVKFLAPVRPGTDLTVRVEVPADPAASALRFEVRDATRAVASGHFERSSLHAAA